jgi:hypothetical protein
MSPETHALLMEMASCEQQFRAQHLTNLLSVFAAIWANKKEYLKSKGVSVDGPFDQLLSDAFDAKRALDSLILQIEMEHRVGERTPETALLEVRALCQRLIESMDNSRR